MLKIFSKIAWCKVCPESDETDSIKFVCLKKKLRHSIVFKIVSFCSSKPLFRTVHFCPTRSLRLESGSNRLLRIYESSSDSQNNDLLSRILTEEIKNVRRTYLGCTAFGEVLQGYALLVTKSLWRICWNHPVTNLMHLEYFRYKFMHNRYCKFQVL